MYKRKNQKPTSKKKALERFSLWLGGKSKNRPVKNRPSGDLGRARKGSGSQQLGNLIRDLDPLDRICGKGGDNGENGGDKGRRRKHLVPGRGKGGLRGRGDARAKSVKKG